MGRKLVLLCLLLCLMAAGACAEEQLAPLPIGGPAPYAPHPDCFDADGWGYQDESITVRAEEIRRYDTDITVVRVTVKDPSQVRTAMRASIPAKLPVRLRPGRE